MQKWGYKIWNLEDVSDVSEEAMNAPGYFERKFGQLGLEGWELVWITKRNDAIFQRPVVNNTMLQEWEYEFVSLDKFDAATPKLGAERMTRLCGQKGWELVQIIDGIAYFKRSIDNSYVLPGFKERRVE